MKTHLLTWIVIFVLLASACTLAPAAPTQDSSGSNTQPTLAQKQAEKPAADKLAKLGCGDAVCEGPENADNCPADCAAPAPLSTPLPASNPLTGSAQFGPLTPPACEQVLCEYTTLSLLELQNRPIDTNVLKLFSAAADPQRNLVYVDGIMTPDIAILDGSTEQWIGTVASGMSGSNALKYLHLDPAANYLYIIDATNNELRRIDLNSGEIAGPVKVRSGMGQAAVDTRRGWIYLPARESPYFSAYDGKTLQVVYTTDSMGEGAGWPIYDAQNDAVFVLDIAATGAQRSIYRLDPQNGQVMETIGYNAAGQQRSGEFAYDPASGRFFFVAGQRILVLGRDGSTQLEIPLPLQQYELQSMLFDPLHDRLAVLLEHRPQDGEVASVGGHLLVYDVSNLHPGELVSEFDYGNKPHRLTLNEANGHIYTPNGDASIVWSIDTDSYSGATALRLGDSVEQVVLANGGANIYVNSRLGGSYVASYNADTGAFSTFTSGDWPIPMQSDASGQHLIVLNAWDSTLSVFAAGAETTLLRTIPLGLPRGTTDRLPELAIDTTHHLAFAAYPEFGKIAVVDWQNGQAVAILEIQGYPAGDEGGGPGEMQVAVDEASNRLFVLWNTRQARLQTYQIDNHYALVNEYDLNNLDWGKIRMSVSGEALFVDAGMGRLFAGPYEFDLATVQPTGRSLPQGQRIFAIDPQTDTYWARGAEAGPQGRNYVAVLERGRLAVKFVETFDAATTTKPSFALDPVRRLLYIGYLTAAEVKVYAIGNFQ